MYSMGMCSTWQHLQFNRLLWEFGINFLPFSGQIQHTTNWWHFSYFSQETEFDISSKLSPICMKCQILFPGKNKKIFKNVVCSILPGVLKVNDSYEYQIGNVHICHTSIGMVTCIMLPRWLCWMRPPTGDQEVAGSTPAEVGNILS